jgi:hypothetical protein
MTLQEFKKLNKNSGQHWFNEDTMGFFRSVIETFNETTGYFVTSEKFMEKRFYSARKANFETGRVKTVGPFNEFRSIEEALEYIIEYDKGE